MDMGFREGTGENNYIQFCLLMYRILKEHILWSYIKKSRQALISVQTKQTKKFKQITYTISEFELSFILTTFQLLDSFSRIYELY